jgi:Na+-driven multidrug efflux pump
MQYLGAAFFLWHLWRKGRSPGGVRLRWVGLPRPSQMREFLLVAATLFTRTIFGMSAYFSMTRAATQLGTLATAAHQVAMQTFWFLSYFPEPLSLTAQTLLARDRAHPARAAHWARLLLRSGGVLGVLLAAAVGAVFTRGSWLFTPDVAVQAAVAQLAPIAMLALGICAVMMVLDGCSVGSGSFSHLPPANATGLGMVLLALHVGRQAGWGLGATWWALVAFYITRLAGHLLHYWRTGGGVFAGRLPGGDGSTGGDRSSSSGGSGEGRALKA